MVLRPFGPEGRNSKSSKFKFNFFTFQKSSKLRFYCFDLIVKLLLQTHDFSVNGSSVQNFRSKFDQNGICIVYNSLFLTKEDNVKNAKSAMVYGRLKLQFVDLWCTQYGSLCNNVAWKNTELCDYSCITFGKILSCTKYNLRKKMYTHKQNTTLFCT